MPDESTAETAPADSTHNHPARCCCEPDHDDDGTPSILNVILCPRCPWHGDDAAAAECPSCHTADGHPHTEYCQMPAEQDACRPVEVDGEIIRVHGDADMTEEDQAAFAELVRAARRRAEAEGIGQVSQPATRTSQPDTETRACTSPARDYGDGRGCQDR